MAALSWADVSVLSGVVLGSSSGLLGVARSWSRESRQRVEQSIAEMHEDLGHELRAIQRQVAAQATTLASQGERLARVEGRLGLEHDRWQG